jgi:hypothetical protein
MQGVITVKQTEAKDESRVLLSLNVVFVGRILEGTVIISCFRLGGSTSCHSWKVVCCCS